MYLASTMTRQHFLWPRNPRPSKGLCYSVRNAGVSKVSGRILTNRFSKKTVDFGACCSFLDTIVPTLEREGKTGVPCVLSGVDI